MHVHSGTLQAGAENSDAAADQVGDAGARTSMLAPIKTADLASAMTQGGKDEEAARWTPRSCKAFQTYDAASQTSSGKC